ncbi:MAG: HAMP domain-containing histidine kinase [Chitinophagaceae bacterium]|nr:HAMP domain-containing histidine kinase [Chitinophagaceae bacterium]
MSKLLNRSLKAIMLYAGLILILSIPIYYLAISILWQYEMDEHHIVLTPEANREDVFLLIIAITSLTVLFFVLLLGGFILINRNIARRLWQPFYISLGSIKKFDLNQAQQVQFQKTDIDEFQELNESLDRLLTANIETYRQQKEFADNASHELQTPLAIARSKLEMLLQSSALNADENKAIEDALQAISRAGRINKNLLLLTKIENSQFMDKEAVNISEQIREIVSHSTYFSEDKGIIINTQVTDNIYVTGNRMLVDILLQNLINNAIRHSPMNGSVSILLDNKQLAVVNSGSNSLDQDKIFERFATASSEVPGTGLGLAIVKQICLRYSWKINYAFDQQKHFFTLRF